LKPLVINLELLLLYIETVQTFTIYRRIENDSERTKIDDTFKTRREFGHVNDF